MARIVNSGQTPPEIPKQGRYSSIKGVRFDWAHYLKPGETLTWEGTPQTGIKLSSVDVFSSLFASIFIFSGLFVIFGIVFSSQKNGAQFIGLLIGIAHFSVGFYVAIGRHFVSAHKRKRTFYSLTNSRALISENGTLHSISLNSGSNFEIQHHKDSESIFFDQVKNSGSFGSFNFSNNRYAPKKLGFEWIVDGRDVYQKLLQIVENLK